jgi:WD40 repeat protein/serine/threonine protein kinase
VQDDLAYLGRLRQTLKAPKNRAAPTGDIWTHLGRFEVRRELGRGGCGVVFLAYDPLLRREVALKVPRAEAVMAPQMRERFQREARAAAGLDHPNLVTVYEVGAVGPVSFVVCAYCPGISLAQWLREHAEPVPFRSAAELVATLAEAVQHAHERGVVHRDLKPANVLLQIADSGLQIEKPPPPLGRGLETTPQPGASIRNLQSAIPKIADFGLAKFSLETPVQEPIPSSVGGEDKRATHSGAVVGTVNYMAPEQAAGNSKEVGPAADIFALGVILYELVTRRTPFQGESDLDTLRQVQEDEPLTPAHLRPRMPRDLETICLKCLRKEPAQRYSSAGLLAEDLRRYLAGEAIRARPLGMLERLGRWSRRNPALMSTGVLALAGLAAVVLLAIIIAVNQYGAAKHLRQEQEQTEAALRDVEEQRAQAELHRHQAEHEVARLVMDRGLSLCEQGEVGSGLLWLAHSLELAPPPAEDLRRVARLNLAGWEAQLNPRLRARLPHKGTVLAVAFSPDGRVVVTASTNSTVRRWNLVDESPIGDPLVHDGPVYGVAFSPDGGTILTVSRDKKARLWDAVSGKLRCEPLELDHEGWAAAFHPDGRTFLTATWDGNIFFWDTQTQQKIGDPLKHSSPVFAAVFSPDGRTVLSGTRNGKAWLWDTETRRPRRQALTHRGPIYAVAFHPDGKTILTGCKDGHARLWNAQSGLLETRFLGETGFLWRHQAAVRAVAFSANGRAALTSGEDRTCRLWDVASGRPFGDPTIHLAPVQAAVFSPDGTMLLTAGNEQSARVWDIAPKTSAGLALSHPGGVRSMAFSPDGRIIVTGGRDGTIRLSHVATPPVGAWSEGHAPTRHFKGHGAAIDFVTFSPDGRTLVTVSSDQTVRLWDAATGRAIGEPLRTDGPVRVATFSPDSRWLLTGGLDKTARLWETATGRQVGASIEHIREVVAASFSPDGKTFMTAGKLGPVRFFETASGKPAGEPLAQRGGVLAAVFSPDGRTLLTGNADGTASLWDVKSRKRLGQPLAHGSPVRIAAFSADGSRILTEAGDNTVRLWDTITAKPCGEPLRHRGRILAVSFSPDGSLVLTGSTDGTVRLWDTATGRGLGPPLAYSSGVVAVAMTPDGRTLATVRADGSAFLSPVATPSVDLVQEIVLRTQVLTGLELNGGVVRGLNVPTWNERRRKRISSKPTSLVQPGGEWNCTPDRSRARSADQGSQSNAHHQGSTAAHRQTSWLDGGAGHPAHPPPDDLDS